MRKKKAVRTLQTFYLPYQKKVILLIKFLGQKTEKVEKKMQRQNLK